MSGKIFFNSEDITELEPDERAKKGIFLSFQYPNEISGVSISNFLRTAMNSVREKPISVPDFIKEITGKMELLGMKKEFMKRYLNEGFSGGEKKKMEILQLLMLKPKIAILDGFSK